MPRPRCLAQSSLRSRIEWLLLRLDAFTLLRLLPVRGPCFMHVCARVRVCTCLCVRKLLWIHTTCISMLLVSVKGHYTHTHARAHTYQHSYTYRCVRFHNTNAYMYIRLSTWTRIVLTIIVRSPLEKSLRLVSVAQVTKQCRIYAQWTRREIA